MDNSFPSELFGPTNGRGESLLARSGEWGEIAKLYESMQKASNSHLPAATMKVALDYAHNSGRLLVETVPKLMVTMNELLQFMMKGEQERRETDLETRKLMADLLTRREERRAELRRDLRNDRQKHRRMAKVERILEAILPGLIENVTGESMVIQLIKEIPENELKMIMEHISPKARKLIQTIFARAKAREEKIRSRKKGKRHERSRAA
jgi:rubrerythrin